MDYPTIYSITKDEIDINSLLEQITSTSAQDGTWCDPTDNSTETDYLEFE